MRWIVHLNVNCVDWLSNLWQILCVCSFVRSCAGVANKCSHSIVCCLIWFRCSVLHFVHSILDFYVNNINSGDTNSSSSNNNSHHIRFVSILSGILRLYDMKTSCFDLNLWIGIFFEWFKVYGHILYFGNVAKRRRRWRRQP